MRQTVPDRGDMPRRKDTLSHFHFEDPKGAVVFSFVGDAVWGAAGWQCARASR